MEFQRFSIFSLPLQKETLLQRKEEYLLLLKKAYLDYEIPLLPGFSSNYIEEKINEDEMMEEPNSSVLLDESSIWQEEPSIVLQSQPQEEEIEVHTPMHHTSIIDEIDEQFLPLFTPE